MRSRKLKRLSEPKNFYSRQLVEIGLSKVDFSKFLCYNIYRKMRKKKVISQKLSQVKFIKKITITNLDKNQNLCYNIYIKDKEIKNDSNYYRHHSCCNHHLH